jgi:multicomponent Na+:H+ antiporter subunit C
MEPLLALLVGILYAAGLYMLLRRSIVKLIIGLILLSHAANLLIFMMGRLTQGIPPLIHHQESDMLTGNFSDPIPQALILTAIVIGFGVQAFAVVLFKRVFQTTKTDDIDALNTTDLATATPHTTALAD